MNHSRIVVRLGALAGSTIISALLVVMFSSWAWIQLEPSQQAASRSADTVRVIASHRVYAAAPTLSRDSAGSNSVEL